MQTPPLRAIRGFSKKDGSSLLHLHNVSGGVLGGDLMEYEFIVNENAHAQITTPGATRIYRHREGFPPSTQTIKATVKQGGLLEYLPDSLIPFAHSEYQQYTKIELEQDAGLFWWETVAPGREGYEDLFAYNFLEMGVEITAEGVPIALERSRIEPSRPASSLARMGHYLYFTTFYICRVGIPSAQWKMLEQVLSNQLHSDVDTVWGVSALYAHGLVVRGMSVNGRILTSTLNSIWNTAKVALYQTHAIPPRKQP